MRFDFTFTGQTPIIFHADDVMRADEVSRARDEIKKRKEPFKAADDRFPAWTWMSYLYDDGEKLAMPSENLMKCFMKAGAAFPKVGARGTYKTESQVAILIPDEHCEFHGPKGPIRLTDLDKIKSLPFAEMAEAVKPMGFTVFAKRAAVERKKHLRVRAKFPNWAIRGSIELEESIIDARTFTEILEYAGNRVGLCDWRPSSPMSPGPYGRFNVSVKKAK